MQEEPQNLLLNLNPRCGAVLPYFKPVNIKKDENLFEMRFHSESSHSNERSETSMANELRVGSKLNRQDSIQIHADPEFRFISFGG